MKQNKNKVPKDLNENLELGRYSDQELLELADGDVNGGTWTVTIPISIWVSDKTCPTTACSEAC